MYRKKDYNAVGWDDGQPTASVETNRRLNQGISRNIALLNRSNNSNHSNSIRLKRTENSNDRINLSKEREINSRNNSGLPTDSYNENTRKVPRSIGSVLSLNRKRLVPETHRIPAASSKNGRNIVQNLYMLTNNTPKYADRNIRSGKSPQMNQDRYSPLDRYQNQQRYERIANRRPQVIDERRRPQRYIQSSPRRYQQSRPQRYPQPRSQHYPESRQNRFPETKNEQYNQRNVNRYPQRGYRHHQRNPEGYPDIQKYKDRFNQQQKYETRTPTPNRGSVLRSRRDKSGLRRERTDLSRDKSFKQNGGSRDANRRHPDNQMRKLQQKYMQNLYQLNGPDDKDRRNERDRYLNEPRYRQGPNRGRPEKYLSNRQNQLRDHKYRSRDIYDKSKNNRQPSDHGEVHYADRDQRYKQQYRETRNAHRYRGQRGYPDQEGQYRDEKGLYQSDGYQEEWFDQRGGSKDSRGYYQQDMYRGRGQRGQRGQRGKNQVELKRRTDKLKPIYSGKNTTGYSYPEQIPSTTAGIRTLPEISKYDSLSDPSTPLNSFGSHKQFAKNTIASQVPQKPSVKLDRKAVRPQRQRRRQYEKDSQQSSIQARWQKNNIHLQQRQTDRWDIRNKKAIDEGVQGCNLPSGSVFLPVESRRIEKNQWADDILERIILHLETLNLIADYTKEFKKMYENVEPWEVLIFLTYKKFYIERMKVVNILKPTNDKNVAQPTHLEIKQNPFTLPYSKISEKEISKFTSTRECFALMIELQSQNSRIRNALRGLYNLYIQKSGEHVNMLDCDNFSELIYRLMIQECQGIAQNLQDAQLVLPTRLRMGKIIKVGLLIAFLNGKYIKNFAQIIIHEDIIKVGKRQTLRQDNISQQFLNQFKRVLT